MSKITIRTKTATKVAVKTILGISLLAAAAGTAAYGFASGTLSLTTRLRITEAVTSPSPDIIVQSSTNNPVATFHFSMGGVNATVDTLTLQNCVARTDRDGDCADAKETPGESKAVKLVTITYPSSSGTKSTTGTMTGDVITFTGLDLLIDKSAGADLNVYADINDFTTAGVASGAAIQFNLNAISSDFHATTASGKDIDETRAAQIALGERMVLRLSKPTVTLNSSSPSGSTVVGRSEMLRFSVSANKAGDVTVNSFLFKVNATDNSTSGWNDCDTDGSGVMAASDFDLYNLSVDSTVTIDKKDASWSLFKTTGAACDTSAADLGYLRVNLPTAQKIPKGVTYVFALYADTTGASSSLDDSVRFDLPAQTGLPTGLKSLVWSDGSATGIDGTLIDNLTISGGTLIF